MRFIAGRAGISSIQPRRREVIRSKVLNAIAGLTFAVGVTAGAHAQEAYIPLISKGFQHQFWQAVKAGATRRRRTTR
jgi:ABC-type sugar transport system substrate-binding protein